MGRANPYTTHQYAGIAAGQVKAKADVRSFAEAAAFLGDEQAKIIASHVLVHRVSPDAIAIRLYDTDIVTYYADGTFEADNGGWNTPTTTSRLNQFGPHGWFFGHGKKKLFGRGQPMGKGLRYSIAARELQVAIAADAASAQERELAKSQPDRYRIV